MARIRNVVAFNRDKELMKLSVDKDEVVLTTKEELKDFLVTYLEKEMDKVSSTISVSSKKKLIEMIDEKLTRFESNWKNNNQNFIKWNWGWNKKTGFGKTRRDKTETMSVIKIPLNKDNRNLFLGLIFGIRFVK